MAAYRPGRERVGHDHHSRPATVDQRRPLLGLPQVRPARAHVFVRMPQRAHRHDAGWMLGRTLVELTHVRAKTGQPHDAVAMVRRNGQATREIVVCAAWG